MRRLLLLAGSALAALPTGAFAEAGDLLVRARAVVIAPSDDASDILPGLPGSSVDVDGAIVPELDFTYFITDRIAAELILATSNHDLSGTGGIEGLGDVADVWVLPPTLTFQYHFLPDATVRPYVGVGVNYTVFYNAEASDSLVGALGETRIDVNESAGLAVQAGMDIDLNDTWFFNADVKFINIETEATLVSGNTINQIDIDVNPVVFGLGFGRRF